MVVARIDPVLLALGTDGRVMTNGDGERPLLGSAGVYHLPRPDGVDRRAVGIVELDTLVLLEVASHGGAVAVGLIDVGIVSRRDGAAEPDGEWVARSDGVLDLLPETRERVRHRPQPALGAADQLSPEEQRIGGSEGGGSNRLGHPAGGRGPAPPVSPPTGPGPAPGPGSHPAHVFAGEHREDRVCRAL